MSDLAFRAMVFAREVHAGQVRKYTGNPYADHLAEVAGIVATVSDDQEAIATAWLHDCVEDQGVVIGALADQFGPNVAHGIKLLSDMETGNRKARKEASWARLGSAPGWVQTIKCADLISNTSSIVQHDPDFAIVYLREKVALLDSMGSADPRLSGLARSQIERPATQSGKD